MNRSEKNKKRWTKLFIISIVINLLTPLPTLQADTNPTKLPLIPTPCQLTPGEGNYLFTEKTIFVVENKEQEEIARDFISLFTRTAGFTPKINNKNKKGNIRFITDKALKTEAYQLEVTPKEILIKASDCKGFFYALQTIRQLLPPSIDGQGLAPKTEWTIPALTIVDEPRFGYRGFMLDVSRCFVPKEKVMRILDCMALLKINTLHFHLTDDNGWRLEIKKYPKLTEVGAWRVDHTDVLFSARRNQKPGEPTPIGGFYTQDEMKEIIAYASRRQIEIIPEIDIPAHSNAALASYPQYACPVEKRTISVIPGMGESNSDIIFCAGNEHTFTFLQDIFDEVTALFPSRYIHIGGDEAIKTNWKKCPLCQSRIRKEQLKDEEALQGYFMGRISDYIRSKGKEVMGWDELTNSKIPENAIIFGWQGLGQAALKAAEQGHRFVMTPARMLYLIRYQGPQWFEPVTYFGNITLKDVFDYEPVQKNWKPEYASLLMGVQGSLWTEFCNKPEDVEYLLFPRLAAVAEIAWAQPDRKDWSTFLKGVDMYNEHLIQKGVTYAHSMYNIQHTVTSRNGMLNVRLECIRPDMEIRYTTDGSEPAPTSSLYQKELTVEKAVTLKCATFAHTKQMGQTLELPIIWNKATAKPIVNGTAKEQLLTNGVRGSLKYTDFEWCNWDRNDSISFTIDLQSKEKINTCTIGLITNYGMAAHKPARIRVDVSDDNKLFRTVAKKSYSPDEIFKEGTYKEDCSLNTGDISARYVRITAEGAGKCPANHLRPGQESRIYIDQVMIE